MVVFVEVVDVVVMAGERCPWDGRGFAEEEWQYM